MEDVQLRRARPMEATKAALVDSALVSPGAVYLGKRAGMQRLSRRLLAIALRESYVIVSTVASGGTVGQRVTGLRVVDWRTGRRATPGQVIARSATRALVSGTTLIVGEAILAEQRRQATLRATATEPDPATTEASLGPHDPESPSTLTVQPARRLQPNGKLMAAAFLVLMLVVMKIKAISRVGRGPLADQMSGTTVAGRTS